MNFGGFKTVTAIAMANGKTIAEALEDAYKAGYVAGKAENESLRRDMENLTEFYAGAVADAKRYRWLREKDWIDWDAWTLAEHDGLAAPDLLDFQIDAAILKETTK